MTLSVDEADGRCSTSGLNSIRFIINGFSSGSTYNYQILDQNSNSIASGNNITPENGTQEDTTIIPTSPLIAGNTYTLSIVTSDNQNTTKSFEAIYCMPLKIQLTQQICSDTNNSINFLVTGVTPGTTFVYKVLDHSFNVVTSSSNISVPSNAPTPTQTNVGAGGTLTDGQTYIIFVTTSDNLSGAQTFKGINCA